MKEEDTKENDENRDDIRSIFYVRMIQCNVSL